MLALFFFCTQKFEFRVEFFMIWYHSCNCFSHMKLLEWYILIFARIKSFFSQIFFWGWKILQNYYCCFKLNIEIQPHLKLEKKEERLNLTTTVKIIFSWQNKQFEGNEISSTMREMKFSGKLFSNIFNRFKLIESHNF